MIEKQDEQKQTENLKYGKWICKNDAEEVVIEISTEKVHLTFHSKDEKDELETFSSNCHWYGDKLLFIGGGQKYYVKSANKERMIFGEVKAPVSSEVVWEDVFFRS